MQDTVLHLLLVRLFDYQREMVMRVLEAFGCQQSVMVQMPTGTGKTVVMTAVVEALDNCTVWVVAHRQELVEQIRETFAALLPQRDVLVTSIQWLSRHYRETDGEPGLIVIDEAHHALAETYAEVMNAYPKAKKLGLTATPCRLNGKGFTDLFDVLLCSWSMERLIAEGRLCLYDYFSVKPDSADQLLVDSLKKRGADGDYLVKEMNEVMDVKPSLERLCHTVKRYAAGKKGIVYAISILHAEHIAAFYRENGVSAVAISSKTPREERKRMVEAFKGASAAGHGGIDVLVSVDLFSEGFDCPDVEFIQLARPTLSLAKYLQMVGRGLRVAEGKRFCMILDNVGLYKRFGLPSAERDWQRMFEGRPVKEGTPLQQGCLRMDWTLRWTEMEPKDGGPMMKIMGHERLQGLKVEDFEVLEDEKGRKGVGIKGGETIVECRYKSIELTEDGFACCLTARKRAGQKVWVDLKNGLWFGKKPQHMRLMGIDFATEDGKRLFPRIRSKFVDEKVWLTVKMLELQVGTGLCWKGRLIAWDEPERIYCLLEKMEDARLYGDETGGLYVMENLGCRLVKVESREALEAAALRGRTKREEDLRMRMEAYGHYEFCAVNRLGDSDGHGEILHDDEELEKQGVWHVRDGFYGECYWVDSLTGRKHYHRPVVMKRGFVSVLCEGDWCYLRNVPVMKYVALRPWEIVADGNVCVVRNRFLVMKGKTMRCFLIVRRTDDFSYFVVKEFDFDGQKVKEEREHEIYF